MAQSLDSGLFVFECLHSHLIVVYVWSSYLAGDHCLLLTVVWIMRLKLVLIVAHSCQSIIVTMAAAVLATIAHASKLKRFSTFK
jgi:hypothetical protein